MAEASIGQVGGFGRAAGWSPGQLETEIQQNGWLSCPADPSLLFDDDLETKYSRALRKLGIDIAALSREAGHA